MHSLKNFKYILIGFGKMGERYLNLLCKDGVKDILVIEKKKERIDLLISKIGLHLITFLAFVLFKFSKKFSLKFFSLLIFHLIEGQIFFDFFKISLTL